MTPRSELTIAAPATVPGTGAITIIRVSGPDALRVVDAVVSVSSGNLLEAKGYTLHYGEVPDLDNVIVAVFRAPHSYTGEDSLEISCHASEYIADTLLERLYAAGAHAAEPGEFTQRAFLNGKMDLSQAEAVADVISSTTESAHRVAYAQLKGGFSAELADLRGQLLEMASLLELELDFSEEDVEFARRDQLAALLDETLAHIDRLTESFRLGNAIKRGIPVAIAGAANTGKSTLLNALVGEDRAIVSDIAGTTRDTIDAPLNLGGFLFRFIDTAGIRQTEETVEKLGIDRSFEAVSKAQIVLGVVDATSEESDLLNSARLLASLAADASATLILLVNKADLVVNKNVISGNTLVSLPVSEENTFEISAKTGHGLDALRSRLITLARASYSGENSTFVTNRRHFEALSDAATHLRSVRSALAASLPTDLLAEDLRLALYSLGSITGSVTDTDILQNIFRNFCIGK